MKHNKSQSSLEFTMVFGIALALVVIMGGLFFTYFNSEKKTLDNIQIQKIGDEIIGNIQNVYFMGKGNRITMEMKFPDSIKNITIHHKNDVTLPDGSISSFDYLNITFYADNQIISNLFNPYELYIRFNCSIGCYHLFPENISYYNNSDISSGFKKIRFDSKGDWVAVNFVK